MLNLRYHTKGIQHALNITQETELSRYQNQLLIAVITVVAVLALFLKFFGPMVAGGGLAAVVAASLFSLLFGGWLTGKLGGLTGDMYGAATELGEVVVLLVFVLSAYVR